MRSGVERGDDDRLDCLAASGGGNGILDLREAEPMSDEIGEADRRSHQRAAVGFFLDE